MFNHLKMPRVCYAPDTGEAPAAPGTPSGEAPPATPPATAPVAAPWAGSTGVYTIGEGDSAKPWWDGVKEEPIREYAQAKNYANPEEALRAAWNANQINKMTPEITAVLEGKATPEQESAFYTKLGRPPTPEAYEFKHPDGVNVDKDLESLGRNIFHQLGASPAKAQAAMDMWNKAVAEKATANADAARQENDAALETLSKTWGADLETNRAAGERVMKSLGLEPAFMEKLEGQIGSAAVVELLAKIGRKSDEGGIVGGGNNPPGDPNDPEGMNPQQAQAKITALNADAEFQAKYKNADPNVRAPAVALMEKLFAKAATANKSS